jgi:hypothetical protein
MQIYICNDAQNGSNFVGNIFQHFLFSAMSADNFSAVIFSNVDNAALRVGKAAYLFETFVFPNGFVLNVLLFNHFILALLLLP